MRLLRVLAACTWVAVAVVPAAAHARNLEPGRLFVGLEFGVGATLPTPLLASPAAGVLDLTGEYTLSRAKSVVADGWAALGRTTFAGGAVGLRGRLHDLGLAVSPYGQMQLGAGALTNALGANLPWLGARMALGSDYFLTGNSTVGIAWVTLLGGTLGARPALYGTMQGVVYLSYGRSRPRFPPPDPLPAWGA